MLREVKEQMNHEVEAMLDRQIRSMQIVFIGILDMGMERFINL